MVQSMLVPLCTIQSWDPNIRTKASGLSVAVVTNHQDNVWMLQVVIMKEHFNKDTSFEVFVAT